MDEEKNKNMLLQKDAEQQKRIHHERLRISMDMHDDLGSGLTSIRMKTDLLKKQHHDELTLKALDDIGLQANTINAAMREMVWSLNPDNDRLDQFIVHLRQYGYTFFENTAIQFQFQSPEIVPSSPMPGPVRRNLLLIVKEIYNNIQKHAQASLTQIIIQYHLNMLTITISDNGIGITPNTAHQGNGLLNIKKRVDMLQADYVMENNNPGLRHIIQLPLPEADRA